MNNTAIKLSAGLVALGLAACSGSGTSPKSVSVAPVASNTLQFNVGTANIAGAAGTNVVVTYRQPSGQTGTLTNSPTLTFPAALAGPAGSADGFNSTIVSGPAAAEVGTTSATSTSQNGTNATTFGISGNAGGWGIEPFNYGNLGSPDSIAPYQVPVYDAAGIVAQSAPAGVTVDPNAFLPLGGLPAFDPSGNAAAVDAGVNGVPEGLDVFAVAPVVGTYGLSVANPGAAGASATASLSSTVLLGAAVAPVPVMGASAGGPPSGTATFTYAQPTGAIEGYVQVTDFGPTATGAVSCQGASLATPVYYTVFMTANGTASLPANSLCTAADNTTASAAPSDGDTFTVQVIAFDYHAYEASYPNSLGNAAPSIAGTGASHQADITISAQAVYNLPAGGGAPVIGALPTSRARHSGTATLRKK